MKNSVGFLIFVAGAAIGSAATWYYAKKHYEQIAQEEIDSVKERFTIDNTKLVKSYSKHDPKPPFEAREAADITKEKLTVAEYAKKLSQEGYVNYSNAEMPEENTKDTVTEIPFVIPPEEFGNLESEGYSKVSLTYYADDVLADEDDELVEDVEGWVGEDATEHFGEYDDDVVYVRNHKLKIDFEILRSLREYYTDVLEEKPYLRRYDE